MQVVCKTLCKTWKARSWPLYLTLALPPPPSPPPYSFFFFFLLFKKKLLRLKINILSSFYPEMNFPAEPVMKINNLSRPNVPAPPPPRRINWSSPYKTERKKVTFSFVFPYHNESAIHHQKKAYLRGRKLTITIFSEMHLPRVA